MSNIFDCIAYILKRNSTKLIKILQEITKQTFAYHG
nr:MAG TPA: hypothetical protein [Caudoviricetes sp.]